MALGMKQWLGLVGIGVFFVGLATLPPSTMELPTRRNAPLQAERYRNALRTDAARTNNRLQRLRWARTTIPATLSGEGPVVFGFADNTNPEHVERVRTRVLDELEGDPASTDVALGLFFEDIRENRYAGAPASLRPETHYYYGERDGRPYCVTVHPTWRQGPDNMLRITPMTHDGSYLGVCDLVRKYGLPGSAVGVWLAGGGTALAATGRSDGASGVFFYRDVATGVATRKGILGRRNSAFNWIMSRVEYDQCFGGVAQGCAAMFLKPARPVWRGPASAPMYLNYPHAPAQALQYSSIFEPADYSAVANLAQEFGRERFLVWWKADEDLEGSFQEAFGVDVGTWNMKRVSNFVAISKPGPGVSQAGLMGGALLLALASVLASLSARRRRVG